MPQPKPKKKMGRPKLPKGDAKGSMVVIRFNGNDLKRIESAAKASQKTVSEWIRGTLNAAIEA
jgi:predicted HicB family RNase H-like nuclease